MRRPKSLLRVLSLAVAMLLAATVILVQLWIATGAEPTYYYYLGRWQWTTDSDNLSYWKAPGGDAVVGLLDLRSLPQQGKAGGTPEGFGLFVLNAPNPTAGVLLASGTPGQFKSGNLTLPPPIKNAIRNNLGITDATASDLLNVIWELLTQKADITGQVRWKPLIPDSDKILRLYIGGHSLVKQEPFDPVKHQLVIPSLKEDYRQIRETNLSQGNDTTYKKVLDFWEKQYGLPYKTFIPSDLPDEGKLPHSTVITESFTGDGDAFGADLTWTETNGDWDRVSGQAYLASSDGIWDARADSDLSSADHYSQWTITQAGTDYYYGNAVRFSSSNRTFYSGEPRSSGSYRLAKTIAGVRTQIGSSTFTLALGTYRTDANGSTVTGYKDGTANVTATDTAITGSVRTGVIGYRYGTPYADNFEAGDIGGGASAPTVTTVSSSLVEETTASATGNITATGGENATDRGIQYDIDTGSPYASNVTESGDFGTGTFTGNMTGLTKGELYYFRAFATNSAGNGYGSELTFLTKPDPATSFNVTDNGTTWLSLGWINGTGMDYVEVRYDTASAPADNTTGTLGYWGVGTSVNVTGLDPNTTYYFRIFTHATEGGLWSTSDNNPTAQGTTDVAVPTVTTQAATNVEETTTTGNGNITATGGENADERGFDWDVDSGAPYANSATDAGSFGAGAYTKALTGLPAGTTIYYRAKANNSAGWGYGSEQTFLTKPAAPTDVAATDGSSTSNVTITWTKSTGATGYTIWRDSANLTSVGDVATYADTSAAAGTITSGNATASDGTSASFVTLSVSSESTNNGTSYTYIVQAYNASGNSANSTGDAGYRGVGALSYQWMRSAADSDASYSNIAGGTTDPYNDTGAPSNGDGRYYLATLAADGAASSNTTADRGYRIAALTVITNATSSVEETTATASGNITATGGENADWRGFEWDIDSGAPYSSNWTEAGSFGVGNFTYGLTGLTKGELYYLRAMAHNSAGNSYGSELTFLTKPDPATSFNVTDNGTTWLLLGWINGTGMDYVEVRYSTGSAPSDNTSGTLGYWGSGTSVNVTGLNPNETYYFRIWTHATEGGLWSTADGTTTAQGTTDAAIVSPTVTTQAASAVEETTATGNGNITALGGENATLRGIEYDTDSGSPYASNVTEAGSFGTGAFTANLTGLTKGELYYARALAQNSAGTGYGAEVTFLTKPDPATLFTSTDNGTTWIALSWANGTGADYVEVRYAEGAPPSDNTSGTLGFWGSGTAANVTGLNPNTTYYFRIFTHTTEGGLWSMSDNNPTAQDTTDTAIVAPAVTTSAATSIEESTATLSGNVTSTGGENVTRGFQWDTDLTLPFSDNWSEGTFGTGVYSRGLTGLNKGDKYAFRATANNTAGFGYGDILYFMTKPDPATSFNATDEGTTWVALGWLNGDGMDYVEVRYATGSAPADNTTGTLGYWGIGTTANITGLSPNTTYYFRIFTHAFEDGTWASADGSVTTSDTTDVGMPSVTNDGATGITNNDATLNGTIDDDGGASVNVTWYWDTTDYEQTANWTSSANYTGESAGAISHTITDSLNPSTLYYFIIRVVNTAGTAWSATANFTTLATAPVTPAFTATYINSGQIDLDWTAPSGSVNVTIRAKVGSYPSSVTDGYLAYTGNATSASDTSRDFDFISDQVYYAAYSDNGTDWTLFGQDRAGGLMIILGIFLLASTVLTLAMFQSRNAMLGFPCVILWAITGGQAYLLSSATWDIYFIASFAFLLGMTTFSAFSANGLKTKKEEVKEGDEFIDEGKDDVKFIDEIGDGSRMGKRGNGNGNGNGTNPDGERPSRRVRVIRERAAQRRSRLE